MDEKKIQRINELAKKAKTAQGLTPEDIAVCKRVFQQVCSNAEACIKQKG